MSRGNHKLTVLCVLLPLSRGTLIRPWESAITAQDNRAGYEFIRDRASVWYSILGGGVGWQTGLNLWMFSLFDLNRKLHTHTGSLALCQAQKSYLSNEIMNEFLLT